MKILITGGAGFVGSNLAIKFKLKYPSYTIYVADNLTRRGSELNLPLLSKQGIKFFHADIRLAQDLNELPAPDVIVDASADPSVMSGISNSPVKILQSNLFATVNLLELALQHQSNFVFLSTSRVYPYGLLNEVLLEETSTRFTLKQPQSIPGIGEKGISEAFPLTGARSFYGAAKLSSELLIQEYADLKGLKASILRSGVIAGPGQFGKVDQGVLVFWLASHYWKKDLAYLGYGGAGKQVRDIVHIDDLFLLIDQQVHSFDRFANTTFNIGGGLANSISLHELTELCQRVTGNRVTITSVPENRKADVPFYVTDNTLIENKTGWKAQRSVEDIAVDVFAWIKNNEQELRSVLY